MADSVPYCPSCDRLVDKKDLASEVAVIRSDAGTEPIYHGQVTLCLCRRCRKVVTYIKPCTLWTCLLDGQASI